MSTPNGGGNEPYGEPNRTEYRLEGYDVPGGTPGAYQDPVTGTGYGDPTQSGYPGQGQPGYQSQPGYQQPASAPPGYGPASAPPGYGQPAFGEPGYAPPPPPKKSNTGLIIGLVAGVAALLLCVGAGTVGYFVVFRGTPAPTPSSTTNSTGNAGGTSTGTGTGGNQATHKVPTTGCGPADLLTIQNTFGLGTSPDKPQPEQSVSSGSSKCSAQYEKGSGNTHVIADIELNMEFASDNAGAVQDLSSEQTVANQLKYQVETISGVGSQAILVTTSSGRMEIYAVDANVVVDAEWFGYGSAASSVSKDSVVTALKTLANTALTRTAS
ncbi:hypothetical protein [Fodinicola feengrottensis]|uniref:DUF3558 domain-containing protein n=1 Tax=Fodinicola feengrottensis TaxID=435914 RepID=A0ABN2I784_9ACTN|nr:hypothetical protein [Fodinicola feengrottensis]